MNLRTLTFAFLLSFAAVVSASAQFVPGITGLHATGEGSLLDPDANYTLSYYPAGSGTTAIAINAHSAWVANSLTSKWIGPADYTTVSPSGNYYYDLEIEIDDSLVDPDSIVISGLWATDNYGLDIQVNGGSSQNFNFSPGSYASLSTFTLSGPGMFQDGTNTLRFIVNNLPGATNNPTGLRVEFTSAIPEPTTYAAAMGVLVLLIVGYRRVRQGRAN